MTERETKSLTRLPFVQAYSVACCASDDCMLIGECLGAINQFRADHGIDEPLQVATAYKQPVPAPLNFIFWKKTRKVPVLYSKYLAWNATRKLEKIG